MEIATFVVADLQQRVSAKATLGQLAGVISATSSTKPSLAALATAATQANDVWVAVKHRNDPSVDDLREGLETVRRVFEALETA